MIFLYSLILITITLLWPSSVLAVQGHGGAEGLVAHQIGHALFVVGIGYLLYKIYRQAVDSEVWKGVNV